ncbi:MAG: hypothetical protein J5725_12090 [Bacteroidales bacterium]|nr:hypothetical protein [Bacteroidales bacterium]
MSAYGDQQKAYDAGYIAALVTMKAHHMQVVAKWDYLNPSVWEGHVSNSTLQDIKDAAHIPWCTNCGGDALFEKQPNGKYTYCLSNYCPKCGALLNEEIANKSPEDSIKEQMAEINELYNAINDDLQNAKEDGNLDGCE